MATALPKLSKKAQARLESLYSNFFAHMEKDPGKVWMDWPVGETYMASGGPRKAVEEYAKSLGKPTLETFVELAFKHEYLSPGDHQWLLREVAGF